MKLSILSLNISAFTVNLGLTTQSKYITIDVGVSALAFVVTFRYILNLGKYINIKKIITSESFIGKIILTLHPLKY